MKRGEICLLFLGLATLVLVAGIVDAFGECDLEQELFSISSNFDAHGEAYNQGQYDVKICFSDFFEGGYSPPVGVGPHDCIDYGTYSNSFIRLSGQFNAHAEDPAGSTPGYVDNICFGNLSCFLADTNENCNESGGSEDHSLIVSLSGTTNAHLGLADYYDYALCCASPGYDSLCNYNGTCDEGETPMNCPDCESVCGDGVIDGFEECDCDSWGGCTFEELGGHDCTDYTSGSQYVGGDLSCIEPDPNGENGCIFDHEPPNCDYPECNNMMDDDGDEGCDFGGCSIGGVWYVADFACDGWGDNDESDKNASCQNGLDDDGDGKCDFGDLGQGCDGSEEYGDTECDSYQDDSEAECGNGEWEAGEICDCGEEEGAPCEWGNEDSCEAEGFSGGGILYCDDSCHYDVSACEGYPGFCIAEEPFYFEDVSGALLSPSSCQDYNRVYEGLDEFNDTQRKKLCSNDCVPGASDPVNNGYGGIPLLDWGCAYANGSDNDGECYFYFNSTDGLNSQCRLDYEILSDCGPDNPFRKVNVTSEPVPSAGEWTCAACSNGASSCETEIRCPQVIQLPLIGALGIALAVIVITLVYVYLKRKK